MSLGPVVELKDNILENRAAFWDTIYEKYYGGPVLPSVTTTTTDAPTTIEPTTNELPTSYDAVTTVPTTTPGADGAVSLMISNGLFMAVL